MAIDLAHPAAAFGIGVALGTSPGPVQLLLFSEATRGGVRRGLLAMLGANATFGAMLALLAAGLSSVEPSDVLLRVVKIVGGGFLVFLAIDALRESRRRQERDVPRSGMHPSARGIVAVLLNPGVYLFLATTGAAVAAGASQEGGSALAFATVAALLLGVSLMDMGMVLLGSGAHRMSPVALRRLGDGLALALAALGLWLIVDGALG